MMKLCVSILVLTLAACATQLGVRDIADQRLTMFSQIVFAPDYDSRRKDHLAKWLSPLRIMLQGEQNESQKDTESHKASVKSQAKALADLTGLDIAVVDESKPSNVTIFFARAEKMEDLAGGKVRNAARLQTALLNSGCHSYFDEDAAHRITNATIFIRTGEDITTLRACLAQEMTRILGLRNDSELIQPSIFNASSQLLQMTALDLKFIRALYAPALKPGMPRREALQAVELLLQ